MSIDANDLVEATLDEQARRNAAFLDQPDTNTLITDLQQVTGERVGMQADVVTTVATHGPHKWDDTPLSNTVWNFFSWDT